MESDFDRWLKYHGKAYSGFAKWINENKDQVRFMRRILEQYTIEQLSGATDRLYALDDQPRGYGEHARRIRQIIASDCGTVGQSDHYGPTVRDDHLTGNCWRCLDYGVVSVLSPATLKRIRNSDPSHGLLTCALACDCERGRKQKLTQWRDGHCLIRYEDVIDEAAATHRDMWDVACEMVRQRDSDLQPHAVELTGDVLP